MNTNKIIEVDAILPWLESETEEGCHYSEYPSRIAAKMVDELAKPNPVAELQEKVRELRDEALSILDTLDLWIAEVSDLASGAHRHLKISASALRVVFDDPPFLNEPKEQVDG